MGQYTIGDRSNILLKAGRITWESTVSDPILEPFSIAVYFDNDPNTITTNVIYWEVLQYPFLTYNLQSCCINLFYSTLKSYSTGDLISIIQNRKSARFSYAFGHMK